MCHYGMCHGGAVLNTLNTRLDGRRDPLSAWSMARPRS